MLIDQQRNRTSGTQGIPQRACSLDRRRHRLPWLISTGTVWPTSPWPTSATTRFACGSHAGGEVNQFTLFSHRPLILCPVGCSCWVLNEEDQPCQSLFRAERSWRFPSLPV